MAQDNQTPADTNPTIDESAHTDVAPTGYKLPKDFDPAAELRRSLLGGMKGPAGAAGMTKPEGQKPKVETEAETEETETEEVGETDEVEVEEEIQEEEEDQQEENLIQDPEALLQAHEEMKGKLTKRTTLLKELALLLGEKDLGKLKDTLTERLAAETPAAGPVVLEATRVHPLASVGTEEELAEARTFWKSEKEWCRKNPEGGSRPGPDGQTQEWSAEDVTSYLQLADEVLETGIADHKEFLTKKDASAGRARTAYAFVDSKSPLHREADQFATAMIQATPELKLNPNWPEIVCKAYVGELISSGKYGAAVKDGKVTLIALQKDKPAAKPAPKTPPVNRAGGSTPPSSKARAGDVEVDSRLAQGDTQGALRAMIKSGFRKAS